MQNSLAVEAAPPLEEVTEGLAARAQVCRLLAAVFAEEPAPAFLDALRTPESLAALAEAGLRFDPDFLAPGTAELAEQLAREYTNLFAATGGFPPVESVRLTGRYQQEPYFAVKQMYRQWGFTVGKGRFAVFEDQLGVELSFAAALLERSLRALEGGDLPASRRIERELKRFWTVHLGKWVRGYGQLAARAAEHSFYREMARFLHAFAEEEIVALGLRLDDQDKGRLVVPKQEPRVEFNPDEPVCNGCGGGDPLKLSAGLEALR